MKNAGPVMKRSRSLEKLAVSQWGYFTAHQARELGYVKQNHPYHIRQGHWEKVDRGLFRLPGGEDSHDAACMRWYLWSANTAGQPQAVITHRSALHLWGLAALTGQEPVSLTVPSGFGKRCSGSCTIHLGDLALSQLKTCGNMLVTDVTTTLRETAAGLRLQGTLPEVVRKAFDAGWLTQDEAREFAGSEADRYSSPAVGARVAQARQETGREVWQMIYNRSGHRPAYSRGFTLVELLVVITIIAILASFLFPSLTKVMQTSRGIQCLNNQRTLVTGNLMYTDEYNGWCVPITATGTGAWPCNIAYGALLGVKLNGDYRWPVGMVCPLATLSLSGVVNGRAQMQFSYGMGYDLFPTAGGYRGYKYSQIVRPSEQLNFIDGTDFQVAGPGGSANPVKYASYGEYWDNPSCTVMTAYRHRGGANVVFYDGHGKWMPSQQIYGNSRLWYINQ